MENKIIIITCTSDGIGKEAAKALANLRHTIIIHGRNKRKTQATYA